MTPRSCRRLAWLLAAGCAAATAAQPQQWLDRMNEALTRRNYDGVFSHWQGGRVETLRILHRIRDGVVTERLVSLDGSGREFIGTGSTLTCYLPDQRTVLVERRTDATLLGNLPRFDDSMRDYYSVESLGTERLLGRRTELIALRPRDGFRYGYELWIQHRTGMPLKTALVNADGQVIEQVVFSSLSLRPDIADAAFKPDVDTAGFRWLRNDPAPAGTAETVPELPVLPPGFRMTAHDAHSMPGADEPVQHLVFSDGIASVSVFLQPYAGPAGQVAASLVQMGPSSYFTAVAGGRKYVAVGVVPPATLRYVVDGFMREAAGPQAVPPHVPAPATTAVAAAPVATSGR
ncbi:MAG TPA: MucB/RseB C-terminal domain-containing protein [Steroidobacteraceae bacterium]|nr:MucB/RseB C-terminal domain-containing protein [Steroidobacteraceae bacterium]